MSGQAALSAKVFGRLDQAGSKDHLPVLIHRNAGHQRILLAHQPLGKTKSVSREVAQSGEYLRDVRQNHLTAIVIFTPDAEEGILRFRCFLHHH